MIRIMKNKNSSLAQVWLSPLLFVALCFALNYQAGSLVISNVIDERTQRDFNAALGMPLMIGYLWLSLRIMHRRAGKRIAEFLLQTNNFSRFSKHSQKLEKKLIRHIVIAIGAALAVTLLYLISEDLLAVNQSWPVLLLNIIAVIFWFFLILFIMQSASFTRHLYRSLVLPVIYDKNDFSFCKGIIDLGIGNMFFAIILLVIIPIFWIGKPVPLIDLGITLCIFLVLFGLLFWPVIKMQWVINHKRKIAIENIEHDIATLMMTEPSQIGVKEYAEQLYGLNQQLEDMKNLRCCPLDLWQNIEIIGIYAVTSGMITFVVWLLGK